jgi:hypothetical protein
MRHYLKNTQYKKRTGRAAQVIERLPSKHEAEFKPQYLKKKKKKKKKK